MLRCDRAGKRLTKTGGNWGDKKNKVLSRVETKHGQHELEVWRTFGEGVGRAHASCAIPGLTT